MRVFQSVLSLRDTIYNFEDFTISLRFGKFIVIYFFLATFNRLCVTSLEKQTETIKKTYFQSHPIVDNTIHHNLYGNSLTCVIDKFNVVTCFDVWKAKNSIAFYYVSIKLKSNQNQYVCNYDKKMILHSLDEFLNAFLLNFESKLAIFDRSQYIHK